MTCDLERLERLLHWRLSRLLDHIDFEDLEQECRIAAWRAVAGHTGGCSANRLMITAIDCEVKDFLRSPMNRTRRRVRRGADRVPAVSLDYRSFANEEKGDWPYPEPEPRAPDFVEPLVERHWARWVWENRATVLRPTEIAVLAATVLAGQRAEECAKAQGRSPAAVWAETRRALERYRAWLATEGVRG